MIVEWFLGALAAVFGFFLSTLPSFGVPSWVSDQSGAFADLVAMGAGMGVWLPWSLIFSVVAVVFGCIAVGFGIKVVRMIASFLTAGGGSAG